MVKIFHPYDETPIEEYPGFLALEWDESDLVTCVGESAPIVVIEGR